MTETQQRPANGIPKLGLLSLVCPILIPVFSLCQFAVGIGDAWNAILLLLIIAHFVAAVGLTLAVLSLKKKERWPIVALVALLGNLTPLYFWYFR